MNQTRRRVAAIVGRRVHGEKSVMGGRQYYFRTFSDGRAYDEMARVYRLLGGTNIKVVKVEVTGVRTYQGGMYCGPWLRVTVEHDSYCKCKSCASRRRMANVLMRECDMPANDATRLADLMQEEK